MNKWHMKVKQTTPYPYRAYVEVGCPTLTINGRPDLIGIAIHVETQSMPCNGCLMKMFNCPAYAKLRASELHQREVRTAVQPAVETVRQEAARRGLSISEVRRQRAKEGGR